MFDFCLEIFFKKLDFLCLTISSHTSSTCDGYQVSGLLRRNKIMKHKALNSNLIYPHYLWLRQFLYFIIMYIDCFLSYICCLYRFFSECVLLGHILVYKRPFNTISVTKDNLDWLSCDHVACSFDKFTPPGLHRGACGFLFLAPSFI